MALIVDSVTYSLVINSADKISGTNNNATYQVNWMDFLPLKYSLYKLAFSFQSIGGGYGDGVYPSQGLYNSTFNTKLATGSTISTFVQLADVTNLTIGMYIVSPYTLFGTYITAIGATSVVLSQPLIQAIPANSYITFYNSTANTILSLTAQSTLSSNTLTVSSTTGLSVGQIVIGNSFSSNTLITSMTQTTVTISLPTIQNSPTGTVVQFYNANSCNGMVLSSARVLLLNQGKSYTFDTQTKGPSTNLGILQRDIQLANSKSNSLSCFYCQNAPRCIARPYVNLIQINIMNNSTFSGGIIGYSNGNPIFSTTPTNQNFLTDTNPNGNIILNDMTNYTMIIEFIPIADSIIT